MSYTRDRFTGEPILKTPLKLIGAKTRVRDLLYLCMPNHHTYVEPFMGSCGVLMGKRGYCTHEIVGDLNDYAINFFKVIQQEPREFWVNYLCELAVLDECGKRRFEAIKELVVSPVISAVDKAVYFYLITKVCMNGIWRLNKSGACNSSYCGTTKGRGWMPNDRIWFDKVRRRIEGVEFQIGDYQETLQRANFPGAFTLLDPPYHDCKTTYNGISWGDADFIKMFDYLQTYKGKWLLTINDNAFIRSLFKDYRLMTHDVHYSCSQTVAGRGNKPELLIANYDAFTTFQGAAI